MEVLQFKLKSLTLNTRMVYLIKRIKYCNLPETHPKAFPYQRLATGGVGQGLNVT